MASVASRAVEEFKGLEDFKSKVGEATYDAYLKGFAKWKEKVSKAFSHLDLLDNIIEVGEQEKEEEGEAEVEAKSKS